jgi:hypothetical protein
MKPKFFIFFLETSRRRNWLRRGKKEKTPEDQPRAENGAEPAAAAAAAAAVGERQFITKFRC